MHYFVKVYSEYSTPVSSPLRSIMIQCTWNPYDTGFPLRSQIIISIPIFSFLLFLSLFNTVREFSKFHKATYARNKKRKKKRNVQRTVKYSKFMTGKVIANWPRRYFCSYRGDLIFMINFAYVRAGFFFFMPLTRWSYQPLQLNQNYKSSHNMTLPFSLSLSLSFFLSFFFVLFNNDPPRFSFHFRTFLSLSLSLRVRH